MMMSAVRPGTPREAWQHLLAGNGRFISGTLAHPRQDVDHRDALADGQRPFAALFGCADSRLSAEIIFDLGLGDLFVVRNAGQTISQSVIGSLEYAVSVLGVNLILVLAHDDCGAVRAAIDSRKPDSTPLPVNIRSITDAIQPAIDRVLLANATNDVNQIAIDDVGKEHLRDTISELLSHSELSGDAVANGSLGIVGATYNLREGHVIPSIVFGDID
jgi:carbonic anhydrase